MNKRLFMWYTETQHIHSTICRIFSLYTLWPLASTKVRRKFLKRLKISLFGASNDTQSRTEWPFVSSRLSMLSICCTYHDAGCDSNNAHTLQHKNCSLYTRSQMPEPAQSIDTTPPINQWQKYQITLNFKQKNQITNHVMQNWHALTSDSTS